MNIDYVRIAKGDLTARAYLDQTQIDQIKSKEKGTVEVKVEVKDSAGSVPIRANMLWAWVPKKRFAS